MGTPESSIALPMRLHSFILPVVSVAAVYTKEEIQRTAINIAQHLRILFPTPLEHTNVYEYVAKRMAWSAADVNEIDTDTCCLNDTSISGTYQFLNQVILRTYRDYVSFPEEHEILKDMLAASLMRSAVLYTRDPVDRNAMVLNHSLIVLPHVYDYVEVLVERLNIDSEVYWEDGWMVTEAAMSEAVILGKDFGSFWRKWSQLKNACLVRPESVSRAYSEKQPNIAKLLENYLNMKSAQVI